MLNQLRDYVAFNLTFDQIAKGKPWNDETLNMISDSLGKEFFLPHDVPGGFAAYSVVFSIFIHDFNQSLNRTSLYSDIKRNFHEPLLNE